MLRDEPEGGWRIGSIKATDGCGGLYSLFDQVRISMLDFTTQKKLLEPILKNPENQHCADCDSIAPTCTSRLI
jgi:hypothetical protein